MLETCGARSAYLRGENVLLNVCTMYVLNGEMQLFVPPLQQVLFVVSPHLKGNFGRFK